eukprot:scaffold67125_cov42-Tisochrysis_lutea.AAC.1
MTLWTVCPPACSSITILLSCALAYDSSYVEFRGQVFVPSLYPYAGVRHDRSMYNLVLSCLLMAFLVLFLYPGQGMLGMLRRGLMGFSTLGTQRSTDLLLATACEPAAILAYCRPAGTWDDRCSKSSSLHSMHTHNFPLVILVHHRHAWARYDGPQCPSGAREQRGRERRPGARCPVGSRRAVRGRRCVPACVRACVSLGMCVACVAS